MFVSLSLSLPLSLSLSSGHLVSSLLPWVGLLTVYISLEMKGVTLCLLTTLSFRAHCEPFRCVCLYSISSGRDLLFLSVYFLPCLSSLAGRLGRIYVFVSLGGQESLIHWLTFILSNAIQNLTRAGIFFLLGQGPIR